MSIYFRGGGGRGLISMIMDREIFVLIYLSFFLETRRILCQWQLANIRSMRLFVEENINEKLQIFYIGILFFFSFSASSIIEQCCHINSQSTKCTINKIWSIWCSTTRQFTKRKYQCKMFNNLIKINS